jgi:hypothetical protein
MENDQMPRCPGPAEATTQAALDAALRALHLGEDLTDEIIGPAQRSRLESRKRSLEADLRCATRKEIGDALMSIRLVMGAAADRLAPEQAARKLDIESLDLADVPLWALLESVKAYRRGETGDGKWRPKSGQLRKYAMQLARPFIEEAAKIDRVLSAPVAEVRPRAERKAMLDKLNALVGEVTKKSA